MSFFKCNRVNVFILSFIIVLSLTSCAAMWCNGRNSPTNQEKAKKLIAKNPLKYKAVNPNNKKIRTDVLYKSLGYSYNELEGTTYYYRDVPKFVNPEDHYEIIHFYRFYNSGRVFRFQKKANDTISDANLFVNNENQISYVLNKPNNTIIDFDGANCKNRFIYRSFEIRGDTLIIKHGDHIGSRVFHYYRTHKVSKSIIEIPEPTTVY